MVTALENMGVVPLQFKLDGKRPDLTKLDSILGLLASESSFFSQQVQKLVADFKTSQFEAFKGFSSMGSGKEEKMEL